MRRGGQGLADPVAPPGGKTISFLERMAPFAQICTTVIAGSSGLPRVRSGSAFEIRSPTEPPSDRNALQPSIVGRCSVRSGKRR
jgi:hypothetical protein